MAHKKGASSSRNGRDSNAQRLGVKRFGSSTQARSWSASAALTSTPALTLAVARMTLSSLSLVVLSNSALSADVRQ